MVIFSNFEKYSGYFLNQKLGVGVQRKVQKVRRVHLKLEKVRRKPLYDIEIIHDTIIAD